MNGKKARMLRGLAGIKASKGLKQQYRKLENTTRTHPHYKLSLTKDGHTIRELIGTFQTFTIAMDSGSRLVYKAIKNRYLTAIRG